MRITKEMLKKLCRYECLYSDIVDDDTEDWDVEEPYVFTLDDLYHALLRYTENHDLDQFESEWFWPILSAFDLDIILTDEMNEPDGYPSMGMPTQYSVFSDAWYDLYHIFHMDTETTVEDILKNIQTYVKEKDFPLQYRTLSKEQKKTFIKYWEDRYSEADEEIIALYRKYLEELCRVNSKFALRTKAFACYGHGNGYYAQDWDASMECLLKWFEMTGSPAAANALGYMYYYGRCNNAVPQYEEAFRYFSVGAAGYMYESRYKLSDMFRHGYGVPKNEKIAASLIGEVYNETLPHILEGHTDTPFADAALRAGNIFRYGIGRDPDYDSAVYYYLQAKYAVHRRMRDTDQYGDQKVARSIDEALNEILPDTRFANSSRTSYFSSLQYLLSDSLCTGYRMEMKIHRRNGEPVWLVFRMVPKTREFKPKLFITLPGSRFCGRLSRLKIHLLNVRTLKVSNPDQPVEFDEIRGCDFFLYGRKTATLRAEYSLEITDAMIKEAETVL